MRDAKEVAQAVRFDWHGMRAARLIERDRIEAKLEVLRDLENLACDWALRRGHGLVESGDWGKAAEDLENQLLSRLTPTDSSSGKGQSAPGGTAGVECPYCHGTGTQAVATRNGNWLAGTRPTTCPECNGTGRAEAGKL